MDHNFRNTFGLVFFKTHQRSSGSKQRFVGIYESEWWRWALALDVFCVLWFGSSVLRFVIWFLCFAFSGLVPMRSGTMEEGVLRFLVCFLSVLRFLVCFLCLG